jgi:hypothetical protein
LGEHKLCGSNHHFKIEVLEGVLKIFWHRISLCNPGWPQTHDPPTSASGVLGLQMSTTILGYILIFKIPQFKNIYVNQTKCGDF